MGHGLLGNSPDQHGDSRDLAWRERALPTVGGSRMGSGMNQEGGVWTGPPPGIGALQEEQAPREGVKTDVSRAL